MIKNFIYKKTNGFTIVELLIVIVIIAILATLVVSAYNGIQSKANNTQTINAVRDYVLAIRAYAVDKGEYPWEQNDNTLQQACMAPPVAADCGYYGGSSVPSGISSLGIIYHSNSSGDTLRNNLSQYLNKKEPEVSSQTIKFGNSLWAGAYYIFYRGNNDPHGDGKLYSYVFYVLSGDTSCGNPGSAAEKLYSEPGGTLCRVTLGPLVN